MTLADGRVGSYRYDALGRRTAVRLDGSLVRRYVYGGSLWPQARIDAAGSVLERYVYGSQAHVPDLIVRRDGQRIRLITDSVGSVRVAVDAATGVVLEHLDYDAYGRTTRDTNPGLQPFGYKGALSDPVADAAGLVWMGVRAYQPSLARFTTADSEPQLAEWVSATFAGGDPVGYSDPRGASVESVNKWAGHTATVLGAGALACLAPGVALGEVPCAAMAIGSGVAGTISVATDLVLLARGKGDVGDLILDTAGVLTGRVIKIAGGIAQGPGMVVDEVADTLNAFQELMNTTFNTFAELYHWARGVADPPASCPRETGSDGGAW